MPYSQLLRRSRFTPTHRVGRPQPVLAFTHSTSSREDENKIERRKQPGGWVNFPDLIELWTPKVFKGVGAGMVAGSILVGTIGESPVEGAMCLAATGAYWKIGLDDMRQESHTLRRNFPFLGNLRYVFESFRPEIRQYFIEGDDEASPFDRHHRAIAYQRAKDVVDTVPFGTRRPFQKPGFEYAQHSMFPKHAAPVDSRVLFGGSNPDCKQPYSASLLNISAMSYGALSDNAILALSTAAAKGDFYHNTGEGGMSRFHLQGGGSLVWNIGTGYFGCGQGSLKREFDPVMFAENATRENCKMIEIKISQGAKPAHGGMLPKAKITEAIAEARGLAFPATEDCNSPATHSAFDSLEGLCYFIARLRELSGGKPVGFKICIGKREEFIAIVQAMLSTGIYPDFITIDGTEGGTGAAPPEFTNSVGMPLEEGLTFAHGVLLGAGLRDRVRLIAAGKVLTGFSVVKTLALGADVCNSARAMMFALGCIQSLKCNTNTCPTGIATQEKSLMAGLVVPDKATRVANFQRRTVETACEIVGAMGYATASSVSGGDIMRRFDESHGFKNYNEIFPWINISPNCLVDGEGPKRLQGMWNECMPKK